MAVARDAVAVVVSAPSLVSDGSVNVASYDSR